jgi:hypothetical protein
MEETTRMAHRPLAPAARCALVAASLAAVALCAPAADAALVYVKKPTSLAPEVWAARDGGGHRRRLGGGTLPVIAADGSRAAWRTFGRRDRVFTASLSGGPARRVVEGRDVGELALSPDGSRLAVGQRRRVVVYDTVTRREVAAAPGRAQGLSFSPDSAALAMGLGKARAATGSADVQVLDLATGARRALTTGRRSINPVWGPAEIVYDRVTPRRRDAPTYQIRAIRPDGAGGRRITHLRIPSLLSGLVPLDFSADGRRLVAEFVGQDTSVGFTVNPATGRTASLSRNQESGFVAADLSRDGRTVLGTTGGVDPTLPRDVVTRPYGGGRATTLVRGAAYPDWSR